MEGPMGELIACGWPVTALAIVGGTAVAFSCTVVGVAGYCWWLDRRERPGAAVDGWWLARTAMARVWSWRWDLVLWWALFAVIAAVATWSLLGLVDRFTRGDL